MQLAKKLSILLVLSLYLGLSNGRLAIYSQNDLTPLQTLPYNVSLFSAEDRNRLEKGIPFSTAAELSRLLEDYTS